MVWTVLMARAMARDFSWDVSARRYEQVYAELVGSDEEVAA
jgi:glycogen synthase